MGKYQHASFLTNMRGIPKHWFKHKSQKNTNSALFFYDAKNSYHNTLTITDGLTGVYHIILNGNGLKTTKSKTQAITFAKKYMRTH